MTDNTSLQAGASWQDLREFRDVDLAASYILSWSFQAETLQLEVDLVLLADHPLYEKPRPSQTHCLRAAVIEFPVVDALLLDGQSSAEASPGELLAGLKPGLLQTLVVQDEGHYVLAGDFGTVAFQSERPVLRILSH